MTRFFTSTAAQGAVTGVLVILFALVGLYFGAPPQDTQSRDLASIVLAFLREDQTRSILAMILIDVATGVIAALRVNTFDGQRLAGFLQTNVIPYVLGYMIVWLLAYFGLAGMLPAPVLDGLASFGYGAVMSTLTISIVDNLARARAGTVAPEGAPLYSKLPVDGQG